MKHQLLLLKENVKKVSFSIADYMTVHTHTVSLYTHTHNMHTSVGLYDANMLIMIMVSCSAVRL